MCCSSGGLAETSRSGGVDGLCSVGLTPVLSRWSNVDEGGRYDDQRGARRRLVPIHEYTSGRNQSLAG